MLEFMWRGLETWERQALRSISIRFVQRHTNSIFTVNTPILRECYSKGGNYVA
jgi:hypothetical protein